MATIGSILTLTDSMTGKLNSIQGSVDGITSSMDKLNDNAKTAEETLNNFSWQNFSDKAVAAGEKISSVGTSMTLAITAPLILLGKKLYSASTDYETAFVGMTKTVDGTVEQYDRLNAAAKQISESAPMGYVDVMGTMQTGGNLGVKIDQMEAFTRSYAALESATDRKISGEAGVKLVADFLTIMEGGVQRIEPFGSALVDLGNNFNATEDQILSMAKRMASAAVLAGFGTPQVLGMATAFSAVGIEAEAGGSAASKMIKQMQLSAEVGEKARQAFGGEFGSAIDFKNYLSTMKTADVVAIAETMGTTADQVQSMADSWLSLEQFAQVSGKTADQFVKGWGDNPAQGMMDFFFGLNKMDTSGVESTLAMLDKMGITEVRQSNLVGAMAAKPELFAAALMSAIEAYEKNTAMWTEFEKQTNTQESQNQMLGNKLQNSMADLGSNLVTALQPALDAVNGLLDSFNNLSEVDQDKIIKVLGALAITGPVLIGVGKTVTAVGKISGGIQTMVHNAPTWGPKLTAFFSGPTGWVVLGTAAVVALVAALEDIPSNTENIINSLKDIKINIDQDSLDKAMSDIGEVQALSDLLAGGKVTGDLQKTSNAVQMGYGTSTMYNRSLGFESSKVEQEITNISSDYAAKIEAATQQIINAQTDGERATGLAAVEKLENDLDAAVKGARDRYAVTISNLFNGMAGQYPEMADKLKNASQSYDLLSSIWSMFSVDSDSVGEQAFRSMQDQIFNLAKNTGYLDKLGMGGTDSLNQVGNFHLFFTSLKEQLEGDLAKTLEDTADNPILSGFLATILESPAITENLDVSQMQGALDGIAGLLDFKQAAQTALDNGNANLYGENLVLGLGNSITANADKVDSGGFNAMRDAAIAALQTAFNMHSPSRVMAQYGVFIAQGVALGVRNGIPDVYAAFADALNFSAGFSIGLNMMTGLVAGINTGRGMVTAAARTAALSAYNAAKNTLGIHSPSTLFMELGMYSGEGFAIGIQKSAGMVGRVVESLLTVETGPVWDLINTFNQLETADMMADDKNKELKVSEQDLKRVRDLATREVINRFTTAELTVEFTANNNISSDLDLDGIVAHLENVVEETLIAVAEGVHR